MCVCLYNLLFVFVCVASQELNGILCYHNVKSAEVCVCVCARWCGRSSWVGVVIKAAPFSEAWNFMELCGCVIRICKGVVLTLDSVCVCVCVSTGIHWLKMMCRSANNANNQSSSSDLGIGNKSCYQFSHRYCMGSIYFWWEYIEATPPHSMHTTQFLFPKFSPCTSSGSFPPIIVLWSCYV